MEAIGFTDGDCPENDMHGLGLFSLTLLNAFFEGICDRYSELDKKNSKNHFLYNMVTLSNGKTNLDGFPIIRVLIEIVNKSKELIDLKFK